MIDDYLLEEFHEAGIWLHEELEILRAQQEKERNWDKQMAVMAGAQNVSLRAQQSLRGQHQRGIFGNIGGLLDGIFDRGLR